MTGYFIVFEGGEGSGKSTQSRILSERLGCRLTREPGGTGVGTQLRAMLLDPANEDLDIRTEALLMAADRAQHVATVIRPELEAGRHVICDRYIGSTVAYQGFGRGLDIDTLIGISMFAADGLKPDLVINMVVSEEESRRRLAASGVPLDRFESTGDEFHQAVADGYLSQAMSDPTWVIVNGDAEPKVVADDVAAVVKDRLGIVV